MLPLETSHRRDHPFQLSSSYPVLVVGAAKEWSFSTLTHLGTEKNTFPYTHQRRDFGETPRNRQVEADSLFFCQHRCPEAARDMNQQENGTEDLEGVRKGGGGRLPSDFIGEGN